MRSLTRISTTDMEVTSIRLERALKDSLKDLAGNQGYQALVREILWNYVYQKSGNYRPQVSSEDIRSSIEAVAHKDEHCAITGKPIAENERMLLGWTMRGELVPISLESL